jgi:circadian clock protein KaiC
VESLDALLGSGYQTGSTTLVAGPSGAGKTVLGLHFVFEGVRRGESAVLATLEENPSQLARAASGFGWSLQAPEVHLMYRSAVDLYLDEWVHDLLDVIECSSTAWRTCVPQPKQRGFGSISIRSCSAAPGTG